MEALGGRGGIAPTHSRVVSITPRSRFTPGTHCTGGWVGPRAGLDTEVRGKILCPCRGSNPDRPVLQPVVRHYTAWATPAPWYCTLSTYKCQITCLRGSCPVRFLSTIANLFENSIPELLQSHVEERGLLITLRRCSCTSYHGTSKYVWG
jgi:hypothetical protein